MIKKILKVLGIILGVLVFAGGILFLIINEKEPEGVKGPQAEALTDQMLQAVDKNAWDTTRYVQWSFAGMHHYLWNKEKHLVQVTWDKNRVVLDHDKRKGKVWVDGKQVEGEARDKLVQKAWEFFANDSFWFIAPFKARDPGTERSLVTLDDGRQGLKVKYTSGGVTPGDAYVWLLNENGRPEAWKLFVKVIPIGGIRYGWDEWEQLSTGAWISGLHKGLIDLDITNIQAAQTLKEMGVKNDPFN